MMSEENQEDEDLAQPPAAFMDEADGAPAIGVAIEGDPPSVEPARKRKPVWLNLDKEIGYLLTKSFCGEREGWVFKSGPWGVGYYVDQPSVTVAAFIADQSNSPDHLLLSYIRGKD